MKMGYTRISKSDGSQNLDIQVDTLLDAGVSQDNMYHDKASGIKEKRSDLENCLKALREEDILIVWKLNRLGRSLKHLINIVQYLTLKNIGLKVLTGKGANIDTTTANGKLIFGIFATLAEFERELIRERTIAGLQSAKARGKGGIKFNLLNQKYDCQKLL